MMRLTTWGKRFALVVLGLAIPLLLLEVGLRLSVSRDEIVRYAGEPVPEAVSRWVDHPFFPFVGRPDADYDFPLRVNGADVRVHVKNNAYGFRSREFPAEKKAGDFFIVTLGESTTWGSAAETNAATWPELLEARLKTRYPARNVEVFNFGTQNVTLPYSVVALSLYAAQVRPDLVITYHGCNEFGPATARGYRSDHAHFLRDLAIGLRFTGFQRNIPRGALSSYAVAYLTALADDAIAANVLSSYVQQPIQFDDELLADDGLARALTREWQHLRTIDALARGYGGTALFSTFQFFDGKDPLFRAVNGTLRDFLATNGLAYVDQDALIPDSDSSLQYDVCHFTRAGDEVMAKNFFEYAVQRRLLEKN